MTDDAVLVLVQKSDVDKRLLRRLRRYFKFVWVPESELKSFWKRHSGGRKVRG